MKALAHTGPKRVVLLADHNSILDEMLDSKEPAKETTANSTSAYTRATQIAREVELDCYTQIGLMDSWPLIHEQSEDPTEMGLTYPAKDLKRRIDRVSAASNLSHTVPGVYTVGVGQSDHLGLVLHIILEEESEGASGRTISICDKPSHLTFPLIFDQSVLKLNMYTAQKKHHAAAR